MLYRVALLYHISCLAKLIYPWAHFTRYFRLSKFVARLSKFVALRSYISSAKSFSWHNTNWWFEVITGMLFCTPGFTFIYVLSASTSFGLTAKGAFYYQNQSSWAGMCATGSRQSPIYIDTGFVKRNSSLTNIKFSTGWSSPTSGKFENTRTTLKFTPASKTISIDTFLGVYYLQQFHFHWGPSDEVGSEHTINGQFTELEIHFVLYKRGTTDSSWGDHAAVIGVLADVASIPTSKAWSKMNISAVKSAASSPLGITDLVCDQWLPKNREYYYYQGSYTTPPCSEIVQWFILKKHITVPASILEKMRMVQQSDGRALKENYRELQAIGRRKVMEGGFKKPAHGVNNKSFSLLCYYLLTFTLNSRM